MSAISAMSGADGGDSARADLLRQRLDAGLRQIAFFVVPSAMAFLALGDVIAAALLETGRFGHADSVYVWGILAGSAVGLLASTLGRLYSSTYYALRDTRTPLRYAIVRVALTTVLGYVFAIPLPRWLGISSALGRGRADGVGRTGRLGGDAAAAAGAERADRQDGTARRVRREVVGVGHRRRCRGVGREARASGVAPGDRGGRSCSALTARSS